MSEANEDKQKRNLRELEGKNISYFSVMLSAWVQTKMERDKTLVTLSSAAIGLLITLITTVGADNWKELIVVMIVFGGYGLCILTSLTIYELNSKHIENEIRQTSSEIVSLEKFDKRSIRSFIIGSVFFMIFGLLNSLDYITEKEANMSNDIKKMVETDSDSRTLSIDGIGGLNPEASSGQESNNNSSSESSGTESESSSESNNGDNNS